MGMDHKVWQPQFCLCMPNIWLWINTY
jgi:hypothetical protein